MSAFHDVYARAAEADASAPGRINLIGEHTDYSGGFVLPMALPLRTHAALALRSDDRVRGFSTALEAAHASAEYRRGDERRTGGWIDYVQGVTRALDLGGHRVPGFDLLVSSTLPAGGGLASSAALEVAVARALRAACGLDLDDVRLAAVAHAAETDLVGAPVGIMDQMAASLADERSALFLDTRSLTFERVPWPSSGEIAIVDSGIAHRHVSGEYRQRRAECEQAAAALGVRQLRDASTLDLDRIAALPAPLDRRARHVVTENARVIDAVAAMRAADLPALGRLFLDSHESMRRDYDVSLPEIDILVDIARGQADVFGARLTGGGFGGAVIALCRGGRARVVAQSMLAAYHSRTAFRGRVLLPFRDPGWHDN